MQLSIISLNIRSLSLEKLLELKKLDADIILLQEVRIMKPIIIDGYRCYYSLKQYAGVITYIKNNIIIKNASNIIDGRLICIELESFYLFNLYHKRLEKNKLDDRKMYDILLDNSLNHYNDKNIMILGDINSLTHFYDNASNLTVKEDITRKPPDDWKIGDDFNIKLCCYEKYFMSYFLKKHNLLDNGYLKGYTYKHANGSDKFRIDYCLTRNVNINEYKILNIGNLNEISDHKAIHIIVNS